MDEFRTPRPRSERHRLTLSAFLGLFTEIETEADGYAVTCPSHPDSRPSLRVAYNAEARKLAIKCRAGCETATVLGQLGLSMADLFDVDPGDLPEEVRSAGPTRGKPSVANRAALRLYLDRVAFGPDETVGSSRALRYASDRFGIGADKARDLGLGYDDGSVRAGSLILSGALYHDAPRLVVPFYDFDSHAHYLQARALHEDGVRAKWSGPANPGGGAWGKYGVLPGHTGWAEAIITEGPGDGLTAAALGFDVVLIRGAALATSADLADEIAAGLRGRRVIVAGDNDPAGQTFNRSVAAGLSSRGVDVYRLALPAEVEDLTHWRESAGADTFARAFVVAVQEAARYGNDQIIAEEISQDLTRLFSDVHNARTLLSVIRDQGGDVRYTPQVGFIVYRPEIGVWQRDAAEWVRSQAQTVAQHIQRSVLATMAGMDSRIATISEPEARNVTGKLLDAMRKKARSGGLVTYVMSTRGIDSMLRELRALPGVFASYEDFDQHAHLLAVSNGVVDLETGELRPYGEDVKDLYLMRWVDVPYTAGARNPRWERFVREIFAQFPDTEDGEHAGLPAFLQRLIGYGITGHTSEQVLAVFYGGGSNGKGVLVETLAGLLRGIVVTTPFSTFEQKPAGGIPNDIAALKGSRLVMASEGEQGRQMAEALIKRLTGGDTISARYLRREFFEFQPTFLIILATNYKPGFRGQDYGLWRRVQLVPFTRRFTDDDRDPHLTSKFLDRRIPDSARLPDDDLGDGRAGILAWAVQGAIAWNRDGLAPPPVVTDATAEFKQTSDALAEFYAEYLVKERRGRISGKEVWELYQRWCDDEHLDRKERWKRSTFWKALEERGAVKTVPSGSVSFRGIRRRRPSEGPGARPEESSGTGSGEVPRAESDHFADLDRDTAKAPSLDTVTP